MNLLLEGAAVEAGAAGVVKPAPFVEIANHVEDVDSGHPR